MKTKNKTTTSVPKPPPERVVRIKESALTMRLNEAHARGYAVGRKDGKVFGYTLTQELLRLLGNKFPGNPQLTYALGEVTRIKGNEEEGR